MRLRNAVSGVVVNVDDATAARLDKAWEPIEAAKTPTPRKAAPKKAAGS